MFEMKKYKEAEEDQEEKEEEEEDFRRPETQKSSEMRTWERPEAEQLAMFSSAIVSELCRACLFQVQTRLIPCLVAEWHGIF